MDNPEQDALRQQIAGKRQEIAEDLDRLEGEIRGTYATATDWRLIVRSHPLAFVGVGLSAGFLLGLTLAGIGL